MNEYRDIGDPSFAKKQDPQSKKSLAISKMLGLFVTLAVITSQRSSTVREVKFKDFKEEKDGECTVFMHATKTGKNALYEIPREVYEMVQGVNKARRWTSKALDEAKIKLQLSKNIEEQQNLRRRIALVKRRKDYLFTFFSKSALQKRFKHFKSFLAGREVKNFEGMTIHDIRKIVLR